MHRNSKIELQKHITNLVEEYSQMFLTYSRLDIINNKKFNIMKTIYLVASIQKKSLNLKKVMCAFTEASTANEHCKYLNKNYNDIFIVEKTSLEEF